MCHAQFSHCRGQNLGKQLCIPRVEDAANDEPGARSQAENSFVQSAGAETVGHKHVHGVGGAVIFERGVGKRGEESIGMLESGEHVRMGAKLKSRSSLEGGQIVGYSRGNEMEGTSCIDMLETVSCEI